MPIWGKVLGFLFGFMFGKIPGALLGLFVGHLFDKAVTIFTNCNGEDEIG